jgi:hypothetical protein
MGCENNGRLGIQDNALEKVCVGKAAMCFLVQVRSSDVKDERMNK